MARATYRDFKALEDQYGKKAAGRALSQYTVNFGRTAARSHYKSLFEDPKGFFRGEKPPTFEELQETAAVIQGRLQGANEVSDKKARVLAKASLQKPVGQDRAALAGQYGSQQARARQARLNSGGLGGALGAGLFDPTHLARQSLLRNPNFTRALI